MNRKKELDRREQELKQREKAIEKREQELEQKLGPFSQAIQDKKEEWYDKIKLSVHQIDIVIWIVSGLLVIVLILIILEATGIFKIA